jgi:hypothetical protein
MASATASAKGAAELATTAETITGTDTGRVITPAGLHGALAGLTDTTITASDAIVFSDATDSGALKEDTVQGILDLAGGGFTLGTVAATTSGTSINFTSIPSTAKMIIVSFVGVSLNAEDDIKIQIGDSGGLESSGYVGGCMEMRLAVPETTEDKTDSFLIVRNNAAVQVCNAVATLTLYDDSDTWMCHSQGYNATGSKYHAAFGTKSLSATLDRLSLICGSGAFDAGAVNISYQ